MYCKICDGRWSTAITTNARGHLAKKHQIYIEMAESKGRKSRQMALDLSFQNATQKQVERDNFDLREKLRGAIDRDAFYEAQIQLIACRRMAFNCVEWAEYQALLMSINPEVESLLLNHIQASQSIMSAVFPSTMQRSRVGYKMPGLEFIIVLISGHRQIANHSSVFVLNLSIMNTFFERRFWRFHNAAFHIVVRPWQLTYLK